MKREKPVCLDDDFTHVRVVIKKYLAGAKSFSYKLYMYEKTKGLFLKVERHVTTCLSGPWFHHVMERYLEIPLPAFSPLPYASHIHSRTKQHSCRSCP